MSNEIDTQVSERTSATCHLSTHTDNEKPDIQPYLFLLPVRTGERENVKEWDMQWLKNQDQTAI